LNTFKDERTLTSSGRLRFLKFLRTIDTAVPADLDVHVLVAPALGQYLQGSAAAARVASV
jgi:hypothetical protein